MRELLKKEVNMVSGGSNNYLSELQRRNHRFQLFLLSMQRANAVHSALVDESKRKQNQSKGVGKAT